MEPRHVPRKAFSAQQLAVLGSAQISIKKEWPELFFVEGDEANQLCLSPQAVVLNYAGGLFEGMKAYRTERGDWVIPQPALNAERMIAGMKFLDIPVFTVAWFVEAVCEIVRRTVHYLAPEVDELYIRPVVIPSGEKLGLGAPYVSSVHAEMDGAWSKTPGYTFFVYATPVGAYFATNGGVNLYLNPSWRRAVPGAARHKLSSNYVINAVHARVAAAKGCAQVVYTDESGYITECGAANVAVYTSQGELRTCHSNSPFVLPGTTLGRFVQLAELAGCVVLRAPVHYSLDHRIEGLVLTGTAAGFTQGKGLTVAHSLNGDSHRHDKFEDREFPAFVQSLSDQYRRILTGREEDAFGWLTLVDV